MTKKIELKCQYLENGNCNSVADNPEAKEARKIGCANDNEKACCYLCDFQSKCEISCSFLGAIADKKSKQDQSTQETIRCIHCQTKMLNADINLRVGGWSGLKAFVVPLGQLSEVGQELMPVRVSVCPKCGKMEFTAQEKTLQMIVNQSLAKAGEKP